MFLRCSHTAYTLVYWWPTDLTSNVHQNKINCREPLVSHNLYRLEHSVTNDFDPVASDKFWNTSKNPTPGFVHGFSETEGGCRLHYITNWHGKMKKLLRASNLVIFLHGYPDSCVMWRHLLDREVNPELNRAILVCVDMPGYGGSDSLKRHGPDEVLNAVAQFVVNMREMVEEDTTARAEVDGLYVEDRKTFIVGHDWGCLVGMRLAAEAPCLADRFILMNAPHVCFPLLIS